MSQGRVPGLGPNVPGPGLNVPGPGPRSQCLGAGLRSEYVTLSKGIGIGRIETAWGLYLFTGCILASLFIGHRAQKIA